MSNENIDSSRNVPFVQLTTESKRVISTENMEIQNLINIIKPVQSSHGQKRYIITGGPGSGKTTIINALEKKYSVVHESATTIIDEELNKGISEPWQFDDYHIKVNQLNLANQIKAQNSISPIVIFDRGFLDSLSYILLQKRKLYQYVLDCVQATVNARYFEKIVFFIDNFDFIVPGPARNETLDEALQKANYLEKNYLALGYEIIHIRQGKIEERVNLIEQHLSVLGSI